MFLISAFFKADLHLFDAISDFTQFLIYITIDCMVASSAPSSGGRPLKCLVFNIRARIIDPKTKLLPKYLCSWHVLNFKELSFKDCLLIYGLFL